MVKYCIDHVHGYGYHLPHVILKIFSCLHARKADIASGLSIYLHSSAIVEVKMRLGSLESTRLTHSRRSARGKTRNASYIQTHEQKKHGQGDRRRKIERLEARTGECSEQYKDGLGSKKASPSRDRARWSAEVARLLRAWASSYSIETGSWKVAVPISSARGRRAGGQRVAHVRTQRGRKCGERGGGVRGGPCRVSIIEKDERAGECFWRTVGLRSKTARRADSTKVAGHGQ